MGIPEHPSTKIFFSKKTSHYSKSTVVFLLVCFEGICANCAVVGFRDVNQEM